MTAPEEQVPEWWQPYAAEFPRWHAWEGIAGLKYARRMLSSPPRVVRAVTPGGLRDAIRGEVRRRPLLSAAVAESMRKGRRP
jgi:hypothetical protein